MSKYVVLAVSIVALIVAMMGATNLFELVDASQIVLVQSVGGTLSWHTQPGPVWQGFGKVTTYPKRGILRFSATKETVEGKTVWSEDHRLPVVFNDAGKGEIMGSISYELPLDPTKLTELHSFYPTQEALETSLIQPALNKSVYMTGPLMSSYESYKERRPQLIQYVEDQVQNGVYQTQTVEREVADDFDPNQKKRVTFVEILKDAMGLPRRTEGGQLTRFGVKAFNFAIEDLDYEERVQQQIANQQSITMQVQTAIAQAKQAEQQKLTATAQGQAEAEKVKWEQEARNSQIVSQAEGRRRAAEQDALAAQSEKQATLLRASGDAEARKLKMAADGALEQKLATLRDINASWATAFANSKNPVVPTMVFGSGGGGSNGATNAQTLMELLTAKTAKDLSIDLGVNKQ